MTRRARPAALALALLGALACADDPSGPSRGLQDPRGVLLAISGEGSAADVVALLPDGSVRRNLTRDAFRDEAPSWSPDGSKVAFGSARVTPPGFQGPRTDVFVMNADGSGVRAITTGTPTSHPSWSPDGARLVVERYDADAQRYRVYVVNADGSDLRPLTPATSENFAPDWSPDGARILFLSNRAPRTWWTMWVMNADGTGERQLAGDGACFSNVYDPSWSPDGSRIAYSCDGGFGQGVYVMNADGTGARRLSPPTGPGFTYDSSPVWSPDGTRIAYTRGFAGTSNVWVMPAAGGEATPVTTGEGRWFAADWSRP
jgi:TolB protein